MSLPYQFREPAFRRYEHIIAKIVRVFPTCLDFKPALTGLSPVTFSCRLRDAIRSQADNKWPTTEIDMDRFMSIHDQIKVSERRDGTILVGSRETIKAEALAPITADASSYQTVAKPVVCVVCSINEKKLLGWLASQRLLTQPLQIVGLTAEDTTDLESSYDVLFVPNADGTYTLM